MFYLDDEPDGRKFHPDERILIFAWHTRSMCGGAVPGRRAPCQNNKGDTA
jgi:hypothetical protein